MLSTEIIFVSGSEADEIRMAYRIAWKKYLVVQLQQVTHSFQDQVLSNLWVNRSVSPLYLLFSRALPFIFYLMVNVPIFYTILVLNFHHF